MAEPDPREALPAQAEVPLGAKEDGPVLSVEQSPAGFIVSIGDRKFSRVNDEYFLWCTSHHIKQPEKTRSYWCKRPNLSKETKRKINEAIDNYGC
ncbi:hypothetical protein NAD41_002351 [Salmonella enterica]|nr:hypothetical protein [Salmonella enterica]